MKLEFQAIFVPSTSITNYCQLISILNFLHLINMIRNKNCAFSVHLNRLINEFLIETFGAEFLIQMSSQKFEDYLSELPFQGKFSFLNTHDVPKRDRQGKNCETSFYVYHSVSAHGISPFSRVSPFSA